MDAAFKLLDQRANLIDGQAWVQPPKLDGLHHKWLNFRHGAPLRQGRTQQFIHDLLKRSRRAPRLGLQASRNIIIQG